MTPPSNCLQDPSKLCLIILMVTILVLALNHQFIHYKLITNNTTKGKDQSVNQNHQSKVQNGLTNEECLMFHKIFNESKEQHTRDNILKLFQMILGRET